MEWLELFLNRVHLQVIDYLDRGQESVLQRVLVEVHESGRAVALGLGV